MRSASVDTARRTLVVPLGTQSAASQEVVRRLLVSPEPEVFRLAALADGGRRLLRSGEFQEIALAGAPPWDELGYCFGPLVAALARPRQISLVDVERESVETYALGRFLARSAPAAAAQVAMSALWTSIQPAAIRLAAREPRYRVTAPSLSRIAYLLPSVGSVVRVGGSVTHVHEVIRALTAAGVGVDGFTTNHAIVRTACEEPETPCEWRFVRTPRTAKAMAASAAMAADAALARKALPAVQRCDAIYQRHGRFSLAGALLSHFTRKPLFLEYNGTEQFAATHWQVTTPLSRRIKRCEDAALAAAARVVVVSRADEDALRERGIPEHRILLNPNGVDTNRFARGGGEAVRRQLGIEPGALLIGFIGTFGPWHGATVLARAFADIAPRIPSAQLLLVGDGRELDATLELLESIQVGSRTTSTGAVPPAQVPAYLDACDVLVAPHVPLPGGAPFFGSPTKIFEYMAAGKAIVASSLGQIGEVLQHRRTGWLVEPGDVSSLRHGLEAVAADEGLRQALGEAARKQANARHTWRENAERIMSAYSDLARIGS